MISLKTTIQIIMFTVMMVGMIYRLYVPLI